MVKIKLMIINKIIFYKNCKQIIIMCVKYCFCTLCFAHKKYKYQNKKNIKLEYQMTYILILNINNPKLNLNNYNNQKNRCQKAKALYLQCNYVFSFYI